MSGSSAGVITLVVVILLALVGGAVIALKGGSTKGFAAATTTTSGGESGTPSTTTGEGSSESYNAPVEVVKQLDISVGKAPNIIKISKFSMTIYAGTGNVTVDLMLPNPCYNATLMYNDGNATILLIIKSPSPGTVCIQVLKPLSLSTSITPPTGGQVTFIVVVDGQTVAQVPVELPG